MKSFNQNINIEISVDMIANKLLDMFNKEEKHASIVVEEIIGRSLEADQSMLGRLFSRMNGFVPTVNFTVGEQISVSIDDNKYDDQAREWDRRKVTVATVKEINLYADRPIIVEYKSNFTEKPQTKHLLLSDCTKIPYPNH